MNNLINKIRNATLMGVGVVATAIMVMFGVFVMGGAVLLSLALLPLGALAMFAMPKMDLNEEPAAPTQASEAQTA